MSYVDPAEQWAADPDQAMTASLEAALSGLNHKLLSYLQAWPTNPPWAIGDRKDIDLQVRMSVTSSYGRNRAKGVSFLDIVAASLEFDRASQPGAPSTFSYNAFNDLGNGRSRARNGLSWTQDREDHWQALSQSIQQKASSTDAPILLPFILSLSKYSRWDAPVEAMIDLATEKDLSDSKNLSAALTALANQGRYQPISMLLQKVPEESLRDVVGNFTDALQEIDDRGAFRYWQGTREEDSSLYFNHPQGDAPIGSMQSLALKPIDLICQRTGSVEIAVHAIRNYLTTCQAGARPWQEGFIRESVAIVDRALELNADAWPTGDKGTTAGVRNAKIAPLAKLALEEACAPVLRRLPEHLRGLLDSAAINVLWKPENLRQASCERISSCTELLVDIGLDLNALRFHTTVGATQPGILRTYAPLHYVALSQSDDRVKTMIAMLELGADPMLRDHAGRTAEDLLADNVAPAESQRSWAAAARSWAAKQSALSAIEELGLNRNATP